MKIQLFIALMYVQLGYGQISFENYFLNKTLRIDLHHGGEAFSEFYSVDALYSYGVWAGSRIHLIDNLNNGKYYAKLYEASSSKLIFSKGYDTYFGEYQSTDEAVSGNKKVYHESILIPLPLREVKLVIEKRDSLNQLVEIFSYNINPNSYFIIKDEIKDENVKVVNSLINGEPNSKVDVVILSEGYTKNEFEKFNSDLTRFTQSLFKLEPYFSRKKDFNVYGVFKPSEESGTDIPGAGVFRNTVLNTTFYSLGSERYLLTEDNKAVRDLAAFVPYDAIYIMVNHKRYGGGGIYNLYCTFTSDNQWNEYLFLHEFGHSFAGLADEYYTSDVAYNNFYSSNVEPIEPNITALLDPSTVKWKHLVKETTQLPTIWEKEAFEKMDLAWQKKRREMNNKISEMKRTNQPENEILIAENEYDRLDKEHNQKIASFFSSSKLKDVIGAFEGAGYMSKGLYRSQLDCIMFSKGTKPFCAACREAINKVIDHYME